MAVNCCQVWNPPKPPAGAILVAASVIHGPLPLYISLKHGSGFTEMHSSPSVPRARYNVNTQAARMPVSC